MLLSIKKEWRYFLLALGFFTRIPVPHFANFQESELNHSAKYFPLIGIIIGIVAALSFYLSELIFPQTIAVIVSMASTIYLTGAFHEDGLADSADGLGGGWDKERILTIMQDSRLGTYGATALFLVLFTKYLTLNAMQSILVPAVLICAHALSRLSAVWVMRSLIYVKFSGKSKPLATEIKGVNFVLAHVFGLLPIATVLGFMLVNNDAGKCIIALVLMVLVPVLLSWLWWRNKIKYWLGGYTGDTLGAMQQITELVFYLGVLAWSMRP
jgi:adenosylcobinamide-GDP ribazoletransferase